MCKFRPCCCPTTTIIEPIFRSSPIISSFVPIPIIGPVGPSGPPGPPGAQGIPGPQGLPGPSSINMAFIVESSTLTDTTSNTSILMNGMTITPPAGTYIVWFNGDLDCSQGHSTIVTSIYFNNILVPASQRDYLHDNEFGSFSSMTMITVNGSQSIEGRWKTDKGTATNFHRSLLVMKIS